MITRTHYDTLGVPPTAGEQEIRAGFKRAARRAHPDVGGSTAQMQAVNEAHAVLSDPLARRGYDSMLRGELAGDDVHTVDDEWAGAGGHPTPPADAPPPPAAAYSASTRAGVPRAPRSLHGWLLLLALGAHVPLLISAIITGAAHGAWGALLLLPAAHVGPLIWRGTWRAFRWRGWVGYLIAVTVGWNASAIADAVAGLGELTMLAAVGAAVLHAAAGRRG